MNEFTIKIIKQLKDNYSYILRSKNNVNVIVIDPSDASKHISYLNDNNLIIESIFLTHHHTDHTSGVLDLINKFPSAKVFSPNKKIVGTTNFIKNGDLIKTSINEFEVSSTPGHTLDHIILYDKINSLLFSGDTLFRLGCGRIFEGTLEQMFSSLEKINRYPDNTEVYCGHEYTMNNLIFLENLFSDNKNLKNLKKEIEGNDCTIPFKLGLEKENNPFLNQSSKYYENFKKKHEFTNFELFKFVREKKDQF